MRWSIAPKKLESAVLSENDRVIFCADQQIILSSAASTNAQQQLEPIVAELLKFMCLHPNEVISREQLIESVWCNRVVTDNAVSKTITKLRRVLGDNPRKPLFIVTLPKKGYRFIGVINPLSEQAPVSEQGPIFEQAPVLARRLSDNQSADTAGLSAHFSSQENSVIQSSNRTDSLIRFKPFAIVCTLTLLVGTILIASSFLTPTTNISITTPQPVNYTAKALTRLSGFEVAPNLSPNGEYLAFINRKDGQIRTFIKSLKDETMVELSHGDPELSWVGPASWNKAGDKLVYLVTTAERCEYFIRTFQTGNLGKVERGKFKLGKPELIHRCADHSYGNIIFTHDEDLLVFTEASVKGAPYTLYSLRLSNGKITRLNQPEQHLGGNSQFDLHPFQNKLLISSPDKQQWEGFFELDLHSNVLTLLFKLDAYICCGIWDHDGERIVLMGEHPSNKLLSYSKSGANVKTIFTTSNQIRSPFRVPNGQDYFFIQTDLNKNIAHYAFQSLTSETLIDGSANDRLATMGPQNQQIAFISEATGSEEIWLKNINNNATRKVTSFNDDRHYLDLKWSPNSQNLLALKLNELHIINLMTGKAQTLNLPQAEIRSPSFKNDDIVAFSLKTAKGWRVHYYNRHTHQLMLDDQGWQFSVFAYDQQNTLWVDENNRLYFGDEYTPILEPAILQAIADSQRVLRVQKEGRVFAWSHWQSGKGLITYKNIADDVDPKSIEADSTRFDLHQTGLLFEVHQSDNADIYRTISNLPNNIQ